MQRIKNTIYNFSNHTFFLGSILGFIVFMYLFGLNCLDVTNDEWLLAKGSDLTQHYVGWLFYRESPLTFPLGLIENLVYPDKISIIFMDSIPLFAIFFRLFEGVLPETFQYFGIWIMLCFVLQGGISALLIKKITNSKFAAIIGTTFFIFSTVMLRNVLIQDSLAAHWIILSSFALWIYRDKIKNFKIKLLLYSGMSIICILVHTYFFVMVGIISFFALLHEFFSDESNLNFKQFIIILLNMIVAAGVVTFALGAFNSGEKINIENSYWSIYSVPLDVFFRPLKEINESIFYYNDYVYDLFEGYAYLGMGVILLTMIALILIAKFRKINGYMLAMSVIFFIMALGTVLVWNNQKIVSFELPEIKILQEFCGVFRANGRFVWPTFYIIILSSIFYIYKYMDKKIANVIILICMLIQMFDLSNMIEYKKSFDFNIIYVSELSSVAWKELGEKHDLIMVDDIEAYDIYFPFELYAFRNGLKINDTYAARKNEDKIKKYIKDKYDELLNDNPQENVIYIFCNEEKLPQCLNIYILDGFYVGTTKKLNSVNESEVYREII